MRAAEIPTAFRKLRCSSLLPAMATPYTEMKAKQKAVFILKLALCILTFGMAFPNVMSD